MLLADTVGMYVMAIADTLGCPVYTSSYDPDVRQMIENVFPSIRVLPGDSFVTNVMILTGKEGCNACVKFTSEGEFLLHDRKVDIFEKSPFCSTFCEN